MSKVNFNYAKYKDSVDSAIVPPPSVENKLIEDNDATTSLLNVIYSIGADGWPVGDLAVYAGRNASPEVKKFILDNLLRDVSGNANPSSMELDDDTITVLTRGSNETQHQYVQRLADSIDKDKYILDKSRVLARQRSKDTNSSES